MAQQNTQAAGSSQPNESQAAIAGVSRHKWIQLSQLSANTPEWDGTPRLGAFVASGLDLVPRKPHTPGPFSFRNDVGGASINDNYHEITGGKGYLPTDKKRAKEGGFNVTGYILEADARLMAAAPDMLAALIVGREIISADRNSFHSCNQNPDGTFEPGEAAELADYDAALLKISAAIALATEGGAA